MPSLLFSLYTLRKIFTAINFHILCCNGLMANLPLARQEVATATPSLKTSDVAIVFKPGYHLQLRILITSLLTLGKGCLENFRYGISKP